ncbi:MAG: GrpB family protein [Endomicrobiaceae bacterium]|nr:GrpB family protein [Endomicrobiaceae bacterium]
MKKLSEMSITELWQLFPIQLRQYNSLWKDWYLQEEKQLINIIGNKNIERINHIGSTAVIGMISKPTIDILIEIVQNCNLENLINAMKKNNYIFEPQPENPPPYMMFMKGYTENGFEEKVYHLHIRYLGNWNELYFRDYLQIHKEVAEKYGKLKLKLKEQFEHNRDAYTNAKTEFICKYDKSAKLEFANKYMPHYLRKNNE